jgi:hypothetical protein
LSRSIGSLIRVVLLATLTALVGVQTSLAGISLLSSHDTVSPGTEVSFSIGYTLEGEEQNSLVDVYVAGKIPGVDQLFYFPDFSEQVTPWVVGWAPADVAPINFFSFTFDESALEGEYQLYAALHQSGTTGMEQADRVGDFAVTSVTLQPSPQLPSQPPSQPPLQTSPVVSVIPLNGATTSTTPRFSVTFSGDIGDAEALLGKSRITVTSLSSGKVATLNPVSSSGDHWATLFLPDDGMTVSYKVGDDEAALVSLQQSGDGKTLSMDLVPITIFGQTFQLSSGGSYSFTIEFQEDASLSDGTSLSGISVGPIAFNVQ